MAKEITAIRIKRYRGAYILILNVWDTFLTIVFFKRKFYHLKHDAPIRGKLEYTNKEYIEVLDMIKKDAYKLVDIIKTERSLIYKIISFIYDTAKRISPKRNEAEKKEAETINLSQEGKSSS